MEKLILGIICTIITPIIVVKEFLEMRKYNSDYRESKKQLERRDYAEGLNKTNLMGSLFSFFLGIYLLYEYFSEV